MKSDNLAAGAPDATFLNEALTRFRDMEGGLHEVRGLLTAVTLISESMRSDEGDAIAVVSGTAWRLSDELFEQWRGITELLFACEDARKQEGGAA